MTQDSSPQTTSFVLYAAANGDIALNVVLRNETLWLTQKGMADLFVVGVPAINKHLKNVFDTHELAEHSVISISEITPADGKGIRLRFRQGDQEAEQAKSGQAVVELRRRARALSSRRVFNESRMA